MYVMKTQQQNNRRYDRFVFTMNNERRFESIIEELKKDNRTTYWVVGREVAPETGHKHLQGYVEFSCARTWKAVQRKYLFDFCEHAKGSPSQASLYCKKEGNFIEHGTIKMMKQGERTDLDSVLQMIKEGATTLDVIEYAPEVYAKHMRFFDKFMGICEKVNSDKQRKMKVTVLIGPPGVGKTKWAVNQARSYRNYFIVNSDEAFPFDGYDGEEAIILDDFYGGVKYHVLLRWLDGHMLRLNVKGGHRYAMYTHVYITSNKDVESWYGCIDDALRRRITSINYMGTDGSIKGPAALETANDAELMNMVEEYQRLQSLKDIPSDRSSSEDS